MSARGFDQERSRLAQDERNRIAPHVELVDVDSWGNFPLTFTHNAPGSRLGVTVAGCFKALDAAASVAHSGFTWAYGDASNEIKITGLSGLTAGTQYTLRLLVVGKEV